jgi:hypothetical protein
MHSLYITPGTTIFYAMGSWCSSTPAGNTSAQCTHSLNTLLSILNLVFPLAAAMLPTSVSKFASLPQPTPLLPFIHHTARTFPVNGTFTPPQRELYAALLATQKALVKECAVSRGHSLESLHRRSVDVLRSELERVGLPCAGHHVLERILYPHYLAHPIGIGKFFGAPPFCKELRGVLIKLGGMIDLHESKTVERSAP